MSVSSVCVAVLLLAFAEDSAAVKPTPDLKDASYGTHAQQTFDLWKAPSETPAPLVVYIHGGGFTGGDKKDVSVPSLNRLLKAGVSVMAINYRLAPDAKLPAHFLDLARAIQFARLNAAEWGVDPTRIAATGNSAGGCMSLWVGFHDDLADPQASDPVLRQSTRLTCLAVGGAQSTLDPRTLREWWGDAVLDRMAVQIKLFQSTVFGVGFTEFESTRTQKLMADASPIAHLTKDDPPVLAVYNGPQEPLTATHTLGETIHHISLGRKLKEQMDALGVECVVRHSSEIAPGEDSFAEYLISQLRPASAARDDAAAASSASAATSAVPETSASSAGE